MVAGCGLKVAGVDTFNPESPQILFKILTPELQIREILDPKKTVVDPPNISVTVGSNSM